MKFKPMLATAIENLEDIRYPKLASNKLDGIRVIFHPELGMVSRSLKQIPNIRFHSHYKPILDYARDNNFILDGEFYSHHLTFQEITGRIMRKDYWDAQCELIYFWCFDALVNTVYSRDVTFHSRKDMVSEIAKKFTFMHAVEQIDVVKPSDVKYKFLMALKTGFEGLVLRDPLSPYKFGRSTLKEELMLKYKPIETYDGQIIEVIQSTEVDPDAEKTINELGQSVTSKKKGDRRLVEKAANFLVKYEGHDVKVSLSTLTDKERREIWNNRSAYIGRWIEYKGMNVGMLTVPRHPRFFRFRDEK